MPDLAPGEWLLAAVAALAIGISKAGFTGLSLVHVLIFALLFGARDSTGVLLPMLIVADIGAAAAYYRHAQWVHLWRMLPPTCLGVLVGVALMRRLDDAAFAPVLGWIILTLTVLHVVGIQGSGQLSRGRVFAGSMGLLAGVSTMLANAGGPIMTIYLLTMRLAKLEFAGTVAWFFLIINVFKLPFSMGLGLIGRQTLAFDALLAPIILLGLVVGRRLIRIVPQRLFNGVLLAFAAIAALHLIGLF